MQGRELEKKSNIQQFHMAMRNVKRSTSYKTKSKTEKNEFHTLYEISHTLRNQMLKNQAKNEFRMVWEIILCNFLIFVHQLC